MSDLTDVPVAADAGDPSPGGAGPRSRRSRTGSVLGRVGAMTLALLFAVAAFAPLLARHDPRARVGAAHQRPSWQHLLGTNDLGQDLFAQLLHGARVSLTIGVLAAVLAIGIGIGVALLAGYFGGTVDATLMRLVDLTLAFPFIPLVLVVATFLGRGLSTTVLVIGAVIWAQPARVLRSHVLKVLEFGHVHAARGMGASTPRILLRHLLPRLAPLAAAQFVRAANIAISIEAALSFLGLGDPARMSWGSMLFYANAHNAILTEAWRWWILPPGLGLTVTVLGFAFVGYAFEEWGDRRLSGQVISAARRRWVSPDQRTVSKTSPETDLALEARGLRVHYESDEGPVYAVEDVDLTVGRNRLVGLVGESGCGKTTLAMTVLGLIPSPGRVVGGTLRVDGRDLTAMASADVARLRGRVMSLVPQSAMNALNPAYTVKRQIAEAASLTRDPAAARDRAAELLDLVGLARGKGDAFPHELSGGMRQRVVIAMALANEPTLIVADEPLTGLDVLTQTRIIRLLLDLQQQTGVAVLLVSHDLPLVSRVVDDLVVMYAGRVIETGSASQVTSSPHHPYTRDLLQAFPRLRGARRAVTSIPGRPPDLLAPPPGCAFHPRCSHAWDECSRIRPSRFSVGPGHDSACLLDRP